MRTPFRLLLMVCFAIAATFSDPALAEDQPEPEEAKAEEPKPDEAKPDDKDGDGKPDEAKSDDKDGDGKPDEAKSDDKDGDGKPDEAKSDEAKPDDKDGDGKPDEAKPDDKDGDGKPDEAKPDEPEEAVDEDGISNNPVDADGDGEVTAEEVADNQEFDAEFKDIPDAPDTAALSARAEDAELVPSVSAEQFRRLVTTARKVVLKKMQAKIEAKSAKRMRNFSIFVFAFSTVGFLLLAMPLVLRKKYPGQGKLLFKYSALAAVTFFVTVNLFGAVLFGLRTAQGALSGLTNPSLAIASGTFEALDKNADDFLITGKELFLPTIEQMRANPDETPVVALLENAGKLAGDVKVFLKIKSMFKSVDFAFSVLPIILMLVTMILFILAIRPTLAAIVKLPATAARESGGTVGKDVVRDSMRRVKGELLATICTVGVLAVLSLLSAYVLGKTVMPALEVFLQYFAAGVNYLQFVADASTGLVYLSLFGVILFLVLNLAVLILSMSFFLGKCQKIFQQRFNEGTPIAEHRAFFKWAVPAVLFVQAFPLLFMYLADFLLDTVNESVMSGVTDAEAVPWSKLMLAGPLVLVLGFLVLFWAARGFKAIKFLIKYKVKKPEQTIPGGPLRPAI